MYLECFINDGLWLKKNNLLNFKVENNTWGASVLLFHCIILIYNSKRLAKISWKIKTSSFVKKKKLERRNKLAVRVKKTGSCKFIMETLGYVMIGNKTPLIQKVNYLNFVYKKKLTQFICPTF